MDKEIKREALRQYFKYFTGWFIVTGIFLLIGIGALIFTVAVRNSSRNNSSAPKERVYDYANVLTDEEEQELSDYIAQNQKKAKVDIVVVTVDQEMGLDDPTWEYNMMNYADNFYDENRFGWNCQVGDGALLLDNWYEDERGSQKGCWLSTSGKMENIIGSYEEGRVFDAMDRYIDSNPFLAYCAAVEMLGRYGEGGAGTDSVELGSFCCLFFLPFVVALIYVLVHLRQVKAKDTTTAGTYVVNGTLALRSKSDEFIRKNVVSHRIESSGGSSGGGNHGGGSHGHHTSSGGHSHGGGGRRR